ncbi:hypothetical protein D0Z08_05880 [Nocardioides immobilis]|uniref:Uncharacterized protein n=2 Tax=Nocardioides immobilis TaxID=2049295 RepID=A0A417Y5J3_9ACTN|nr:hypothetical protein D0Z08_05880 [Nocardioides immobilis]
MHQRPGGESEALTMTLDGVKAIVAQGPDTSPDLEHRCEVCAHPLYARRSIALGIGPVCLRRVVVSPLRLYAEAVAACSAA